MSWCMAQTPITSQFCEVCGSRVNNGWWFIGTDRHRCDRDGCRPFVVALPGFLLRSVGTQSVPDSPEDAEYGG